ncbi:hypothetical protein SERLADRAFT_437599 [Serpula lacrymans var. lacrymans S7.9]|uniref:Ribosomal lysine N-methyltransferase 4 n=1 Tax=Serpula lacrymans var. lacrymans (strain S7.9) TaxID=578457 RepID=F8NUN1_SERL9|nr:uncharacterized protein SERLADRAFT_437599 [Serpula lacrymans var. lacrymans S7.9]EGO25889.1 hypothetical protein SERLADRAFT_437599 [Serpula lacrymans var. lacrymans S7.9]
MESFITWFQSHGGFIDSSVMDVVDFPGQGRGAIAVSDIPEGHTLFTLPRSLTLSTRTSYLPSNMGAESWKKFKLDEGWAGLILCMMWEEAQESKSKWSEYLASLPSSFTTPMFWSSEDLFELRGTAVVDKIGREDAERDYYDKLLPAIQSRLDLFPPTLIDQHYSLAKYHVMGSRILSRSFQVEKWDGPASGEHDANVSSDSTAMEVDGEVSVTQVHGDYNDDEDISRDIDDGSSDDDDDETEDPSDVAMVPIADLLNARYGSENAKLFYEERHLRMISTKPIMAGEQIWNTYGDLPNSDLLRRYGHVDLVSLPEGGEGNPADVIEIRADLVVSAVSQLSGTLTSDSNQTRIDWWLEEGGDDVFTVETDLVIPEALISLLRTLLLSEADWEKARNKSKPPKGKLDNPQVISLVTAVFHQRLNAYPTTLEANDELLRQDLSLNKRHAIMVRCGEKKILTGVIKNLRLMEESLSGEEKDKKKKRTLGDEHGGKQRSKRVKR